jgi:hypothetical protein
MSTRTRRADEIVDVVEAAIAGHHLLVDAVVVLRPPVTVALTRASARSASI